MNLFARTERECKIENIGKFSQFHDRYRQQSIQHIRIVYAVCMLFTDWNGIYRSNQKF